MRLHSSLIVLLLLFRLAYSTSIPLSACGSGEAVQNPATSVGTCVLPAPTSMGVASVSAPFFGDSRVCGACFNLTGSKGSTIVMLSNKCDSGDVCTQSDHVHFILAPADFAKITDAASTQTANKIGYQQVSCDFGKKISYQLASKPNADYLGIRFSDMEAPIQSVRLNGSPTPFVIENNVWAWRSNGNGKDKALYPATVILTPGANGGSPVSISVSQTATGWVLSTAQFKPVSPVGQDVCVTGSPNQYIYQDALTAGWSDQSYSYQEPINYAFPDPDNVIQAKLTAGGAVQLKFEGGFSTKYIDALKFSIKSSSLTSVKVFFGSETGTAVDVTSEFVTHTLTIEALGAQSSETYLSFLSAQQGTFEINNIMWVFDTSIPTTPGNIDVIGKPKPGTTTSGATSSSSTTSNTIPTGSSEFPGSGSDGGPSGEGKNQSGAASSVQFYLSALLSLQLLLLLLN
ncbi:hypothetical protein DFA_05304 [Cavenderia fasciculata]|uniref:Expansin-like EG45 domain-containing protein n=1 Tax=Cavenderia fasciculata TaxID=261658 RepID=F4PNW9_CACFS|nr:uncharacterized protein DFA_05304 [Cavenderia fasciculata]EGG23172.1 hypothetical protein DFA_05304 [Cavenderia fasciculata]|eukprot:XP_004361023.1 hypothetical protein DFA_05304 [Cavenderia fasciculata]